MKYFSTRDSEKNSFDSAVVIKKGLASDGGLFVPDSLPTVTREEIEKMCGMSYPQRAATVLSKFLTDYTYDELLFDCEKAYCEESFPGGAAAVASFSCPTLRLGTGCQLDNTGKGLEEKQLCWSLASVDRFLD